MADTEKITVNLSAVDLGQIDLLVDQGLYANRADMIRTAIRNQIGEHSEVLNQTITRKTMGMGVLVYSKSDFEKLRDAGEMIQIRLLGMLIIDKDVPPRLARETIQAIEVRGIFQASDELKEALADRIV